MLRVNKAGIEEREGEDQKYLISSPGAALFHASIVNRFAKLLLKRERDPVTNLYHFS